MFEIISYILAVISVIYLLIETGFFNLVSKCNSFFFNEFSNLFIEKANVIKPLYKNIFSAAILLVIVLVVDIVILNTQDKDIIGNFGAFGAFMGGILNPIFMFLTLYALIITIIMQKQELKLAREEYSKTSIALNTQAIENTFFNTINLHYRIVENLKINFSNFGNEFLTFNDKQSIRNGKPNPFIGEYTGIKVFDETIIKIFKRAENPTVTLSFYKVLQDDYNYIFGHYFRNLYQTLKLIDKNDYLKKEEKKKYTSILRAQLSSNELSLLFLNCLDDMNDRGEFKNLLIKYKIFEHLNIVKKNKNYILSGIVKVSEEMVLQYFHRKEVGLKLDLNKSAGGAFGKNNGVPYDILKIKNKELRERGDQALYYNED